MSLKSDINGKPLKAGKKLGKQARRKIISVLNELIESGEMETQEFQDVASDFPDTFNYRNIERLQDLNIYYA